jgi:ribosomal RNA-processing protein 8
MDQRAIILDPLDRCRCNDAKRPKDLFRRTSTSHPLAIHQELGNTDCQYHLTHRALTSAWPSPPLPHIISLLSPLPARTVIADLGCGDAGLAKALVPEGKIVLSYDLVGDRGNVGGGKGEGWVVESDFLSSVPLPGRVGGSSSSPSLGSDPAVGEKKSKRSRGKKGTGNGDEASEVVDVVVCCLSLMGTNWIGGIYEACRILKQG